MERFKDENRLQRGWSRQERCLTILSEYLGGQLLERIDYEANRAASDDWKRMIERAPNVPLYDLPKQDPRWVTREQAHALLAQLPEHSADMMRFALATGLRRSNVTGMEWARVDMARQCCYVPSPQSKTEEPIPLNADAMAVLERWAGRHPKYVFCCTVKGKVVAPIYQVTTKTWREAAKAAGLQGVTFHSMRHSWASWQTQAGTPPRQLQELGGWKDLQMPMRYSHLNPGHLEQYADRSLLGENSSVVDDLVDDGDKSNSD